jgi:predicted permease
MLDAFRRELSYTLRTLRREPTFVAGVVGTFALAIGANAAMLGLVTRLMLSPPPGIREPDRIARVGIERTDRDGESFVMTTTSYPTFSILEQQRGFAMVGAARPDTVTVGRGAELTQAGVLEVSGKYFATLGATATVGRLIGPADDELPLGTAVVVLSHAYWSRRFAADPSIVGKTAIVDGQVCTIVGVAAAGFNGDGLIAVDLFMPLAAGMRNAGFGWWTNSRMNVVTIVARLAPGVSLDAAASIASTAMRENEPGTSGDTHAAIKLESIVPGNASRQSAQAKIALWLSGVSLIVLLIATANVGTLLLLRAARRRRDLAVRVAMGASQTDLARQMLIESALLALAGAAAGVLLSRWFAAVVRATLLPNLAPTEGFIDGRVLVASIAAATVAGILDALSPLVQTQRRNLSNDLRAGSGGSASASGRLALQKTLIGLQIALCTVLLVGAGLFVRSLQRVRGQDLGFSTSGLLHITLDYQGRLSGRDRDQAHRDIAARLAQLDGVRAASVVQAMPFGNFHVPPISIPGVPASKWMDKQPPFLYGATPSYLAMMRVKALQGRLFTDADEQGNQLVALVNESFARAAWPSESPIGKCIRAGHGVPPGTDNFESAADGLPCRTVVGVVRDSRARSLRVEGNETRFMQYYVPFSQLPPPPAMIPNPSSVSGLLVQVTGDEDRAANRVQRTIQTTSSVPVFAHVRSYQDIIDPQLRSWRLGAVLFSAFSALALGIAAVGVFGVVSYLIAQRTAEIGVRLALGATRGGMSRMVVRDAIRLVGIGLGVGGIAAIAAAPLVRDLLFQTSPWEPANLGSAVLVLVAVTVLAALWPAWRASRVDPVIALRSDS